MFTTLAAAIAFHTAQAGPDFTWDNATVRNSRPRSDAFPGLRQWLREAQDNTCPGCGKALTGEVEVSHIVAARDAAKYAATGTDVDASSNRGYSQAGGNLTLQHRHCNVDDATVFGPIVPAYGYVRPDVIALTYPSRAEMLAAARRIVAADEVARTEARNARMALAARGF